MPRFPRSLPAAAASSTAPSIPGGSIQLWHVQTGNTYRPDRFYFVQKSYNSQTGAIIDDASDQYHLPAATPDKPSGSSTIYSILTSKSPVTIAQGGTEATTTLSALNNLGALNFRDTGTQLLPGTDIDTNLTDGVTYYTADSNETQALNGTIPFTTSGMKIIQFRAYSDKYTRQFALGASKPIYHRSKTNGNWNDWYALVNSPTGGAGNASTPIYINNGQASPITSPIPITLGGTGAITADAAWTALGGKSIGKLDTLDVDKITGTLPASKGGTGITSNPSMLVNLASTTADTVFKASPRPGVTGTLPVANGGTGVTSLDSLRSSLHSPKVTVSTTAPSSGNTAGDMYFNSGTGVLQIYTGSAWKSVVGVWG